MEKLNIIMLLTQLIFFVACLKNKKKKLFLFLLLDHLFSVYLIDHDA